MAKSWNFRGVGESTARPSGTENPGGWGVKLEKPSVGGVWIFSGTTQYNEGSFTTLFAIFTQHKTK